jgi:peptidyl-prolyl cis-trans isomerase A (cyclophilin A)
MYQMSKRLLAAIAAAVLITANTSVSASSFVQIQFSIGLIQPDESIFDTVTLELFDDTPATQANFLGYVNDGDYNGVHMHRLASGFVLQGGGYTWNGSSYDHIPTDPQVVNEFGRSNLDGTVAMAKLSPESPGGGPDSATSEFFFNYGDNSANLDDQNGGFTVFARVLGNGMDLINAYGTLGTYNVAQLTDVPLLNGNQFLLMENVSQVQLTIGDTDLDGDVDQDDADLLTTTLTGGTDQPQFDVDGNGSINQADLDLLDDLLMGDIDGDGFVGIADLNVVLGNWNQTSPPGDGDATGDGFVGIEDLNAVLGAWNVGSPPPPAATVPEPAALMLMGLGGLAITVRRRA